MGFLSRLFGRGSGASTADGSVIWLYVRCNRCGEKIRVRINKRTDVQEEYDENGRPTHHFVRKEILGNRCPALMSVSLYLDAAGRITEQEAEGCTVIDQQEFDRDDGSGTPRARPTPE